MTARIVNCALLVGLVLAPGCGPDSSMRSRSAAKPSTQSQRETSDPEMRELDEEIKENPDSADAYSRRADLWLNRGELDRAIQDYSAAIRLDPTNSSEFDGRGFAYHMNNRQEERALADYNEAIRLAPENHHALNNRAYLLATTLDDRFRNGKKAVEDATKACELTNWRDPGYLDTLAVAYAEVEFPTKSGHWVKGVPLTIHILLGI